MPQRTSFPTLPASFKNWTQNDRELNHFAIESFRNVADADYIAARLAYLAQLPVQFLWASQQAVEKYLKFILFLERVRIRKLGHDLSLALKAIEEAGVSLDLTKSSQKFIKEIDRVGRFRYMEVSFVVWWHWIISLDRVVWELRRFCTSDPGPRGLKLIDGQMATRYHIAGGYLEKILENSRNPARQYLVRDNAFVGRRRREVTVRGLFIAVNSPLFGRPQLLNQLAGLAYIPKDVCDAYRALAAQPDRKR